MQNVFCRLAHGEDLVNTQHEQWTSSDFRTDIDCTVTEKRFYLTLPKDLKVSQNNIIEDKSESSNKCFVQIHTIY